MTKVSHIVLLAAVLSLLSCNAYSQKKKVRTWTCNAEKSFKHDVSSYTQGLFFYKGQLFETAGQYGESSLRKVDLATGKVMERINFPKKYFIEGSCVYKNRIYILSWRENTCFVYDADSFEKIGETRYEGEGWGITTDGRSLIMSDGTSTIRFRDPETFAEQKSISVTLNGKKVNYINELEYIRGEIWANVYTSDLILRIDPQSGKVSSVVNCTGLLPRELYRHDTDVLNGIAYDEKSGSIYLTGKNWPRLYKITLK